MPGFSASLKFTPDRPVAYVAPAVDKQASKYGNIHHGNISRCRCPIIMPNIRQLLLILATLPVTTAEAERLFSKVERTATAARVHVMTEDRLEALVMSNTHRRLTPDCDSFITRFAETVARRVKFVI